MADDKKNNQNQQHKPSGAPAARPAPGTGNNANGQNNPGGAPGTDDDVEFAGGKGKGDNDPDNDVDEQLASSIEKQKQLDDLLAEQRRRNRELREAVEEEEALRDRLERSKELSEERISKINVNKSSAPSVAEIERDDEVEAGTPGEPIWMKVKFIKPHTFNVASKKYECLKGDKLTVEMHLANQLVNRGLAYVISSK